MLNDDNSKKEIIRGHVNIIILKALFEGDKYGYEIGKYIENKSEGDYILKQPTLYSSLKRLENRNLINSYWGDENDTNGGRRKYFRLTELGKTICSENLNDWSKSKKIIDKLISAERKQEDTAAVTMTNINSNGDSSSVPHYNYNENNLNSEDSFNPFNVSRSRQLFYEENKKDTQYRTILSKLLSNVKKSDDNIIEKNDNTVNNNEIKQQIDIDKEKDKDTEINQLRFNIPDIVSPTDILKEDKDEKYFEDKLNGNNLLNDKSYSLLPSSSEQNFNSLNKIQHELKEQGFKLNPFNDIKKQPNQFLLLNKINFLTCVFLYLLIAIETVFIYLYWGSLVNLGTKYYIYILTIFLILPIFSGIGYIVNPYKKSKKKHIISSSIISSLMIFMVLVLGIISIALLFNINTRNHYEIILKIVIPVIYSTNFVFYSVIWGLLYKTKKYFK